MDRILTTIETLPDGRAQLNVFTNEGWIRHIYQDMATLERYYPKAATERSIDVV